VLRSEWDSAQPFDFEGEFYTCAAAGRSPAAVPIPVYFGGASQDAVRVGGRHADVYAFWGEPLAGSPTDPAGPHGRAPYGRDPRSA